MSEPRQPCLRNATTGSRNGVSNDLPLCNSPQTHEQPLHLLLDNRFQRWTVIYIAHVLADLLKVQVYLARALR